MEWWTDDCCSVFFIIHFCVRLQFGKFFFMLAQRTRASLIRACTDRITRRFYCLSISIKDAKQSEAAELFSARVVLRRCCRLKLGKTTNWHANAGLYLFNRFNKSDLFQLSWAHAGGWREERGGGEQRGWEVKKREHITAHTLVQSSWHRLCVYSQRNVLFIAVNLFVRGISWSIYVFAYVRISSMWIDTISVHISGSFDWRTLGIAVWVGEWRACFAQTHTLVH